MGVSYGLRTFFEHIKDCPKSRKTRKNKDYIKQRWENKKVLRSDLERDKYKMGKNVDLYIVCGNSDNTCSSMYNVIKHTKHNKEFGRKKNKKLLFLGVKTMTKSSRRMDKIAGRPKWTSTNRKCEECGCSMVKIKKNFYVCEVCGLEQQLKY